MSYDTRQSQVPSPVQSHAALRKPSPQKSKGYALRYALYAIAVVLVVLAIAYVDGGEEPLHPIVQSVSLPSQAQVAL